MDITYLREFIEIAETGSFSAAAGNLFISQSSLSKHIKNLEEEIGCALFNRTTRRMELSDCGKFLMPYAKRILSNYNEFLFEYQIHSSRPPRTLLCCAVDALAQYRIIDIIADFRKANPDVALSVLSQNGWQGISGAQRMLLDGECELAIIRDPDNSDSRIISFPILEDRLVAALPVDHPLAQEEGEFDIFQLKDEDFASTLFHDSSMNLVVKACMRGGFSPRILFTASNLESLMGLVAKGQCVTLHFERMMRYMMRYMNHNDQVALRPFTPSVNTRVCLCYNEGRELSGATQRFLQFVQEYVKADPFFSNPA